MPLPEAERIAVRCRHGDGPDDVDGLARAILAIHEERGCGPELLVLIGRLYTVVAETVGREATEDPSI
jgi:hypothetical protein